MATSGKIFITTGRGVGKGLFQRLWYEKCLNLESNTLEGPFELEKVIDFWNKYDEVKETKMFKDCYVHFDGKNYTPSNITPRICWGHYPTVDIELSIDSHHLVEGKDPFEIKDIIVNHPATIVLWEDGTKTVVKCENEEFDLEKAIAMAFARKALGNKYGYYNVLKKWLKKDKVKNFSNKK